MQKIAGILDVPLDTVKKQLQGARGRLKERMIAMVKKTLDNHRPSRNEEFADNLMDMIHAAEKGDLSKIALLLERDPVLAKAKNQRPSASSLFKPGVTALHYAAWFGQKEAAELLLEYGADINLIEDAYDAPPIGWANENNHPHMVEFFVQKGARMNFRQAAEFGRLDVIQRQLEEDPKNLDFQDSNGTALHAAAGWGHQAIAKFLIEKGLDVNVRNQYRGEDVPLHRAAQSGSLNTMKLLLENDAKVSAQTNDGSTPLHFASEQGHYGVVALLIEHDADINVKRKDGNSSLHLAARKNHTEIVDSLLQHGANANAENERQVTPLTQLMPEPRIVELLKSYSAKGPDS